MPAPTHKQPPYCDENGTRVIAEQAARIAELEALLREADAAVIWEAVMPDKGRNFQERLERALGIGSKRGAGVHNDIRAKLRAAELANAYSWDTAPDVLRLPNGKTLDGYDRNQFDQWREAWQAEAGRLRAMLEND